MEGRSGLRVGLGGQRSGQVRAGSAHDRAARTTLTTVSAVRKGYTTAAHRTRSARGPSRIIDIDYHRSPSHTRGPWLTTCSATSEAGARPLPAVPRGGGHVPSRGRDRTALLLANDVDVQVRTTDREGLLRGAVARDWVMGHVPAGKVRAVVRILTFQDVNVEELPAGENASA